MNQLKKTERSYYDLPAKKQEELLLKAAKSANKQQQELENKYLKLQRQK